MFADLSQSGASRASGSRSAAWTYLDAAFEDAAGYLGRYSNTPGDALDRYDAARLSLSFEARFHCGQCRPSGRYPPRHPFPQ